MIINNNKMNKNNKVNLLIFLICAVFVVLFNTLFVVEQTQQAVIFQFGEPIRVAKNPGLNIKIPFLQNVVYLDNRLQEINTEDKEIIASDQKRLIISAFVKYKIVDPLLYHTTVRDEYGFKSKFSTILDSSLRQVIGEIPLNSLLSEKRSVVMEKIQSVVDVKAKQFGVEIIDVRITRSDLPKANSDAIYKRMQTEREREAKEIRSEGDETAQKIIANTDKEKVILIADATKKGQILMGDGDAEASRIYSRAYSKDPSFFKFYRTMQAYRNSLIGSGSKTKMILSPDNEFLRSINGIKQVDKN